MFSNTPAPDRTPTRGPRTVIPLAAWRLALAVAYPLLAHWASLDDSGTVAVLALVDLVAIVLLAPLARGRGWAWAALILACAGLWRLRHGDVPGLLLLAPPMLFTGALAWWFGRSLAAGRVPLIARIVAALEDCTPDTLAPELARYARQLTLAWTVLLAGLAVANGALALVAEPDGVHARLGLASPFSVSRAGWSWFANLLDYGIVGGFFLGEFLVRQWRFPRRDAGGFVHFLRRMAALGPGFWRQR